MTRLSEIPDEVLDAIRRWLSSDEARHLLITNSNGPSLQSRIKEKFGVDLSPSQISMLRKGYKKYCTLLPADVVVEAEDSYGSLSNAFKQFISSTEEEERIPEDIKPIVKILGGKTMSWDEAIHTLLDMGFNPIPTLTKLRRAGYFVREGDNAIFTKTPVNPVAEFLRGMMYGMPPQAPSKGERWRSA